MLPFPGDWHFLKSPQGVLMKIYWDGGLRDVAAATHKSHTSNSLKSASNFKKTHQFLLQPWESFYIYQLAQFASGTSSSPLLDSIEAVLSQCNDAGESISVSHVRHLSFSLNELYQQFSLHCEEVSAIDETTCFWNRFIHRDMASMLLCGWQLEGETGDRDYVVSNMLLHCFMHLTGQHIKI